MRDAEHTPVPSHRKTPEFWGKRNIPQDSVGCSIFLAETKGFEPLIRLPVYTISSRAHSTTLPRLRCCVIIQITFFFASDFTVDMQRPVGVVNYCCGWDSSGVTGYACRPSRMPCCKKCNNGSIFARLISGLLSRYFWLSKRGLVEYVFFQPINR